MFTQIAGVETWESGPARRRLGNGSEPAWSWLGDQGAGPALSWLVAGLEPARNWLEASSEHARSPLGAGPET